jgi:hypothetical protein
MIEFILVVPFLVLSLVIVLMWLPRKVTVQDVRGYEEWLKNHSDRTSYIKREA